jgi:endonuclease-3
VPARRVSSKLRQRALEILNRLQQEYPDATTELNHDNAFQLLVATILSAQCTDVRVNLVTPALFARYPEPSDLAQAQLPELEELIHSTGFFRNKAKNLKALGGTLVHEYDGRIPDRRELLVQLPGVGRKTANVVLGNWFGVPALPVDTHVKRLSQRLALTQAPKHPDRIEVDLMALFPAETWSFISHGLILHGRRVCKARRPTCEPCVLGDLCPWSGNVAKGAPGR